jgi:RNA polymerase sigma-70 factor (ECF subfamily)
MTTTSKSAATDLELVNAIKSEDRIKSDRAFNALFNKYHTTMVYHFRGLVKDEETANELVLEAFAKVSTKLGTFDKDASVFSTWLFKLTKNTFIDNLRKKKEEAISISDLATQSNDDNSPVEYDIASDEQTPEEKLMVKERDKKMAEIINKMKNAELREVIKMRFFDGMSYEEMSVATQRPLGTIKAFVFRAKEILKEDFQNAHISL